MKEEGTPLVCIPLNLAEELIWWLENAEIPCTTRSERWGKWGRNVTPPMELARNSMVGVLRCAIKQMEKKHESSNR